jgi:hypothetical protein
MGDASVRLTVAYRDRPSCLIALIMRAVTCACANVPDEWTGNGADAFAESHLVEQWVDTTNWRVGYLCRDSRDLWLRDSPQAHIHGGGPPRLRRVGQDEWRRAERGEEARSEPLTRERLKALLDAENVDAASYRLNGERADEALILESSLDTWVVYYAERGLRSGEQMFLTESEACEFLLDRLLRDPSTRKR